MASSASAHDVEQERPARTPVLVVEDDPQVRRLIRWVLQEEGFAVDTAGDGLEAVERASRRRPGAVVLDLMLPGFSGVDVASVLRVIHDDTLPILFLSGYDGAAKRARAVRACSVLRKPVDVEELLEAIRRAVDAPGPPSESGPPLHSA